MQSHKFKRTRDQGCGAVDENQTWIPEYEIKAEREGPGNKSTGISELCDRVKYWCFVRWWSQFAEGRDRSRRAVKLTHSAIITSIYHLPDFFLFVYLSH